MVSVLIVGATGNVGRNVLAGLLDLGVPVRVTTRDPTQVSFPAGVDVFQADLKDPSSFAPALKGDVERVFLYAQLEEPAAFVRALAEAEVRHVVLLSSAATIQPGAEDDANGARFLQIERALEASGLTYTFLRPDALDDNASAWRHTIKSDSVVALPYPEAYVVAVHEKDIADVAVVALTTSRLDDARPLITGPEPITLRQQVAAIGAAIGREIAVVEQSEPEARADLEQLMPAEIVDILITGWRTAANVTPAVSPAYAEITGRPGRTFASWADEHADLYR